MQAEVNHERSDFNKNIFFVDIIIHKDILNLVGVASEARNLAYYELTRQLNDDHLIINIIINF